LAFKPAQAALQSIHRSKGNLVRTFRFAVTVALFVLIGITACGGGHYMVKD
jgi:hypothetical protein